ncbi:hypothetical protein GCM10009619_26550 [Williamsia maris]
MTEEYSPIDAMIWHSTTTNHSSVAMAIEFTSVGLPVFPGCCDGSECDGSGGHEPWGHGFGG